MQYFKGAEPICAFKAKRVILSCIVDRFLVCAWARGLLGKAQTERVGAWWRSVAMCWAVPFVPKDEVGTDR